MSSTQPTSRSFHSEPGSSPIKRTIQSSIKHSSQKHPGASATRTAMAEEMSGLWVGPMPIRNFLEAFVTPASDSPPPPQLSSHFSGISENIKEKELYGKLVELIKTKDKLDLIPGFEMVDTSASPDANSSSHKKIKPDLSMYREGAVTGEKKATRFDKLELSFELKTDKSSEPFNDPDPSTTPAERINMQFETTTKDGTDCRGQLMSYATEWCSRQHRTTTFTVFICHPYARIIRWDRSATVVTEKFDYRLNSQPLIDFLWRFVHLTDAQRGRDETVRLAIEEEAELAREELAPWKPLKERDLIVLTIKDDGNLREFIAWGSMADAESLTGRATRAYPVYEKATGKKYFLKDSWRAVVLEKESQILQDLNAGNVRNVPRFECGGDIEGHTTLSHIYAAEDIIEAVPPENGDEAATHIVKLRMPWKVGKHTVIQRVHHRFTADFIGDHLEHFSSSKQFMRAVYDAFIAHKDAFENCKILHRDVSGKNIMMKSGGGGILNDWDLAKRVTSEDEVARQRDRTGTWQFISTYNLLKPGKIHDVQDDMESFFHVVLYHSLRYMSHNLDSTELSLVMARVFDEFNVAADGTYKGGEAKHAMFRSRRYVSEEFAIKDNEPMTLWINDALESVAQWHLFIDPPTRRRYISAPSIRADELRLRNHDQWVECWEECFGMVGWPSNDLATDHLPNGPKPSTSKRHLPDADDSEAPKGKRSRYELTYTSSFR